MNTETKNSAESRPSPIEMPDLFQKYMELQFVNKAILISLTNKFVYVRVPKVANSSIKFSIYNNERMTGTSPIKQRIIHDIHYGPIIRPAMLGFDSDILNEVLFGGNFFRFSFVRNPYAKALSNFLDRYQSEQSSVRKIVNRFAFKNGISKTREESLSFSDFLKAIIEIPENKMEIHISQQSTQLMLGLIEYDEICSFENIIEEWSRIGSRLWKNFSPDFDNMSPSKTDAGKKLSNYFTEADIELVNYLYQEDFANLGYSILKKPEQFLDINSLLRDR